jgi:hypothetical protein
MEILPGKIVFLRYCSLAAMLCSLPALSLAQAALPDVVKPPPGINLGSTSFYDGFGRTKPGVTLLQYARWSHNTEIADAHGNENASFLNPHIDSFPMLTQLIVATRWHPLGGTAGFSVLVPVVDINTTFAANSPKGTPDNEYGVGDIIAGPTWQSKLSLRNETASSHHARAGLARPYFGWRVQVLTQVPAGSFNANRSSNVGSGYWAVVPYLAATYMPLRKLELSTRMHYQYNLPTARIANPPPIPHLVYKNGQAGQLTYANFTGSYRLSHKLYAGANGYGVYQLSPDKTNNINVGKARETQLYLGPGGGYDFDSGNTLNVNVYLKLEAHNTACGPSLQLLYLHRF